MWRHAGIRASFKKADVLEIRYGAGRDKREIAAKRKEKAAAARKAEQSGLWERDFIKIQVTSVKFLKKGGNAGRLAISFVFTATRRDKADLVGVGWRHVLVSPNVGQAQEIVGTDWLVDSPVHFCQNNFIANGTSVTVTRMTKPFPQRPEYVAINFDFFARSQGWKHARFPKIAVVDGD